MCLFYLFISVDFRYIHFPFLPVSLTEKLVETFINRSPMKCPSDALSKLKHQPLGYFMTAQTHIAHESL